MEIVLNSGRRIGDGHPPFIVAEVGSNWRTLDDCLYSIREAKRVGADAVKFQAYTPEALYGYWAEPGKGLPGELPHHWLPDLAAHAKKAGIEFMCTAFSPELYDAVNPHVSLHKVASAELTHVRCLLKLASYGKPVILSTGASGEQDIRNALEVLKGVPVVLMYCVAAYPAKLANPWLLPVMRAKFGHLVGYSDHALDALVTPQIAVHQGACVLEKHVTFIEGDTPDSPHSLNGREFTAMAAFLRGMAVSSLGPTPEEQGMILRHNRRLIATRDIPAGAKLLEGVNFGVYRSLKDDTKALSPWAIGHVHGKRAKVAIPAGEGIGPDDI